MCMLWLQNRSVMSQEGPRSLEEDEQTAPESLGVVGGLRQKPHRPKHKDLCFGNEVAQELKSCHQ